MSIKGGSYARFRRALDTGNLTLIRGAAAELPTVNLEDALAILPVIAREEPARYDRAACRWLARFALERKVGLEEIGVALAALDRLPEQASASTILKRMIGRSTS